jgi:N4-gp56 family major capsid protein
MAVRENLTSDPLSNQQWAEGLEAQVLDKISYVNYIGTSGSSLIQQRNELVRDAGDTITFGLRPQDYPVLLGESDEYEGNENAITTYTDSIVINEIGLPYRWKTRMSRQRVKFEDREEAQAAISDGMANGLDIGFFIQTAGFDATSGTYFGYNMATLPATMKGNNTVFPPDANHHIHADPVNNSADEDLADGDDFTLELISLAVQTAKVDVDIPIRPLRINGGEYYVVFIHPYQLAQLRNSSSRWAAVQMAALQGGFVNDNPLLNGTMGVWDGCLIVESTRIPPGVHSSTKAVISEVRRAVFCGAQAATIAWGRTGGDPGSFVWEEERFGYGRQRGIAASALVGLKKNRFNSEDFATIVISSWSEAN